MGDQFCTCYLRRPWHVLYPLQYQTVSNFFLLRRPYLLNQTITRNLYNKSEMSATNKWLKRKKCCTTCLQSCKSLAPCSRAVCIVKNLKSYKPEKPMYMMHYNVFNCHNILLKASLQLKKTTTTNNLEIKYANSFVNFLYIPFFLPFFFESSAIINVTFPMKS